MITIAHCIQTAAEICTVHPREITGPRRPRRIARARHLAEVLADLGEAGLGEGAGEPHGEVTGTGDAQVREAIAKLGVESGQRAATEQAPDFALPVPPMPVPALS